MSLKCEPVLQVWRTEDGLDGGVTGVTIGHVARPAGVPLSPNSMSSSAESLPPLKGLSVNPALAPLTGLEVVDPECNCSYS